MSIIAKPKHTGTTTLNSHPYQNAKTLISIRYQHSFYAGAYVFVLSCLASVDSSSISDDPKADVNSSHAKTEKPNKRMN